MKNLIKTVFAVAFTLVAGYSVYSASHTDANVSNLLLDNIEALASEGSSTCYPTWCNKTCKKNGSTYTYQYTSKCSCGLCS